MGHCCPPVPTGPHDAQEDGSYQPGSLCGYCSFCNVCPQPTTQSLELAPVPGAAGGGGEGPEQRKGRAVPGEERHDTAGPFRGQTGGEEPMEEAGAMVQEGAGEA